MEITSVIYFSVMFECVCILFARGQSRQSQLFNECSVDHSAVSGSVFGQPHVG